ncbi:carbamoyl-phosphate synthase small chain [Capsulimonas corticalis]|uniref:Carbamoyl phosphate synthase small chain n=1 Tax=Capsulimonas corticalis TaxID=2219043 RepID=A0A402CPX9_9BACT|nr:glutamine-hydrolyzing carbamoyl-phosphate synthase small subunit [Capsulimonas corticalis]BDI32888.1 carbamoyl-phosphate synthase small chain [Capsulimonas corticalis]
MSNAYLVLADGTTYTGTAFGAIGTSIGEVVFNTGMTGYQEILTDPSYAGQLVTLTYPLIGNYGVTPDDFESRQVQVAGFIIKELDDAPSNWRSQGTLDEFLKTHNVVGVRGLDTRVLAQKLRSVGVMMGAISSDKTPEELKALLDSAASYEDVDFVSRVSTDEPFVWPSSTGETKYKISLLDCGVKFNILRSLASLGAEVTVYPSNTSAETILATDPDGVFLSPGPGDPHLLGDIVQQVKILSHAKPTMGICLGNQLLGCAFGGHTFKLPFGHRGANHPVKDLETGRVVITSQNHGYALAPDGFEDPDVEVWQINLNDGTVEGLRHKTLPVFSIQYHPEASPGPTDSRGYFGRFLEMIDEQRAK